MACLRLPHLTPPLPSRGLLLRVLVTAPLAVVAVGAGFAAQSLMRPAPVAAERDLLDALIADPGRTAAARAPSSVPSAATTNSMSVSSVRAQRSPIRRAGDPRSLAEPGRGPDLELEIRVALLKLPANPTLGATGAWSITDRQGRILQQGRADQAADLSSLMGNASELWMQTTTDQALLADGRAFAGRFRVLRAANGLQVVNHLPLEQYISSVVGGEMPSSWNLEALRAQAVAARSYAMAHMARPADAQWHLGDTTRWQNYEGLSSVTGPTRQATASTSGVILSYQGGIVESLYAATQQIVDEAHGHLGASMSQHGAQELAERGLRYNEILGRFYPGASLARLQAGAG